ncbi:MAG: PHP domain-containing protein [Oscillospiraceae bacterium]|nr:PHP domain-containing protein [Oscillospiraceae bacterium]
MTWKFDLHVHSARSGDGRMTLDEIVAAARVKGLDGVAVCDHDAVLDAVPEYADFLVIPGTEVSTAQGHLLGLFVTEKIAAKSLPDAADAIRAQGGIAVLAHPFERSRDGARLTPYLPQLDGLEVQNSRADRKIPDANRLAAEFAAAHGLRRFAGSDAHVAQEIGLCVTTVEADALTPTAIREALLRGAVKTEGADGKARYVAMSQLTKRKKQHAGAASYAKWALFAAKCCLQDLFGGKRRCR